MKKNWLGGYCWSRVRCSRRRARWRIGAFAPRFSANDTGDITMVSNTLMTCPNSTQCTRARNGDPTLSDSNLQNNAYAMTYVDVDGRASRDVQLLDLDSSTFPPARPSSSPASTGPATRAGSGSNAPPNAALRNQVAFRAPGAAGYTTLTATTLDDSAAGRPLPGLRATSHHSSPARATAPTRSANVQAGEGTDHYAGWSLVDRLSRPGGAGAQPHRLRRPAHGQRHHRPDDSREWLPHPAHGPRADEGRGHRL